MFRPFLSFLWIFLIHRPKLPCPWLSSPSWISTKRGKSGTTRFWLVKNVLQNSVQSNATLAMFSDERSSASAINSGCLSLKEGRDEPRRRSSRRNMCSRECKSIWEKLLDNDACCSMRTNSVWKNCTVSVFSENIGSELQKDSARETAERLIGTADTRSQSMILLHHQIPSSTKRVVRHEIVIIIHYNIWHSQVPIEQSKWQSLYSKPFTHPPH